MEELEPPWAAGTFVADIFRVVLRQMLQSTLIFEPNVPDEVFFFSFGERGQERVTIARFCSLAPLPDNMSISRLDTAAFCVSGCLLPFVMACI